MEPLPLRGDHVLVAHEHQGAGAALALPEKEQVPVDLGFLQMAVHQGEQRLQLPVEGEKLLPLVDPGLGDGLPPHHPGELFGIERLPLRLPLRLPGGALRPGQQGPDHGGQKQQDAQRKKRQQNPKGRFHPLASVSAVRASRR